MQLRIASAGEAPAVCGQSHSPDTQTWRTPEGAVIAYGFERDGWYWMSWPALATFRFSAADPYITAFADPHASMDLVRDTYRRGVLPMALQALGHEAIHASAVLFPRGVVAFAARSGTGKSTVAFGLSRRGFRQWADDGVAFLMAGEQAIAVPLPFDVRLRSGSSGLFGLDDRVRHQFRPETCAGSVELRPTPIAALCLLSAVSSEIDTAVEIRRLAPNDAFAPVLTHAHEFNPSLSGRRKQMLQTYLHFVATVPVLDVRFRPGPEHFSNLLDAIVAQVTAAGAGESGAADLQQRAGGRVAR